MIDKLHMPVHMQQGRDADVLVDEGVPYARVTVVQYGRPHQEPFTANELRELADAMDKLLSRWQADQLV